MRRINQELELSECERIVSQSARGHLAVLGDEDYPYIVPLNYVYFEGKLYFHGALEGHKVDSIRKHDKVSFSIVDDGVKSGNNWWLTFKSVTCFGKIREVSEKELTLRILGLFGDKYFPESVNTQDEIRKHIDHTLVLELNIEHISGKFVNEK